ELGMGIHGEPGASTIATQNSAEIVNLMVEKLTAALPETGRPRQTPAIQGDSGERADQRQGGAYRQIDTADRGGECRLLPAGRLWRKPQTSRSMRL
ncbi:dihydroxyacetone kinase subunit DhaK, partial [Klebsiella pneumoniae]|uniref:dihydroxyacetone kinase subunit DhaK n=1 Tax=Klebsiella pneumoniae TaxID=573 RepID=UPI002109F501